MAKVAREELYLELKITNPLTVNFVKTNSLENKNSFISKPGGGVVVPHSDNKIFGKSGAGKYHIAGFIPGWRYNWIKHGFVQLSLKTAYALYKNVYLSGEGRASEH